MKLVIPSTHGREKMKVFSTPVMSFGFLDVIFGVKGLGIDTYKPLKFIWSYHKHMVNTTWGSSFLGRGFGGIFQSHPKGLYRRSNDRKNHRE